MNHSIKHCCLEQSVWLSSELWRDIAAWSLVILDTSVGYRQVCHGSAAAAAAVEQNARVAGMLSIQLVNIVILVHESHY